MWIFSGLGLGFWGVVISTYTIENIMQQHVDSKYSLTLTYTTIEESFMGGTLLVGKILLLYAPELAADLLAQHPNWKALIETGQFMTVSPEEWKEISNQLDPVVSPSTRDNGDPEKEIITREVFEQLLENEGLHPMESTLPLGWTIKEVRSITYSFENTDIVALDLFVCSSKERQEALYDYYRPLSSMENRSYPLPTRYYCVKNLLIFITYSGQRAVRGMASVERAVIQIALGS